MHSSCKTTAASVPKGVSSMSVFLKMEPGVPQGPKETWMLNICKQVCFPMEEGKLTGPCQRMRPALNCQSRRRLESDLM